MSMDQAITRRQVMAYALLPGIWPRVKRLAGSGFYTLAFLIALVFNAARILPNGHPFLRPSRANRPGIRQVLAEAANHIVPSWKNADKIAIFIAVLAGLVILGLQFFVILMTLLSSPAFAATMPTTYAGFFVTKDAKEDIAFRLLDLVFGVKGFFNSKEIEAGQTAFQIALQSLFEFYSYGLLIIGFFIILYFVVAIVAETAQSGTPFGQRFNHVWAPVRLILFFALLIPITSGLNAGQLIILGAAKYGSGLATNGWLKFNEVLSDTYLGKKEELIAKPQAPEMNYLPAFVMIAKTCSWAYGRKLEKDIDAFVIYSELTGGKVVSKELTGATFTDITAKTKGADIRIVFGERLSGELGDDITPYCGEILIPATDVGQPGAAKIQQGYYDLVKQLWNADGENYMIDDFAKNFTKKYMTVEPKDPSASVPGPQYKSIISEKIMQKVEAFIDEGIKAQVSGGKWTVTEEMKKLGWGGAGIWYNKIAEQNGAITAAAMSNPRIVTFPMVMERIKRENMSEFRSVPPERLYLPKATGSAAYTIGGEDDIANVLNYVYTFWVTGDIRTDDLATYTRMTGNFFIDTINLIFGTHGLFDMCKNKDIHPLAQLSGVGKAIIDTSVRNMMLGGITFFSRFLLPDMASLATLNKFFFSITAIGLTVGFILFYVIPFLPFIYFFFGVGSWLRGVFEAMVGVPLWALGHLRIDGEGMAGEAASGGYFLVLEIFIRPILMIFGLLLAISIFAAMVRVLNEIFYLAVTNLSGHDPLSTQVCFKAPEGSGAAADTPVASSAEYRRGPVDEFFFTIMYTIIVYMIGVSCFKLTDLIPDNILRWLNAGIASYGSKEEPIAEGVVEKVTLGAGVLQGGLESLGGKR